MLAPIISPQYVVWVLPFAAIAAADRAIAVATATMVVLTALVAHHYSDFLEGHRPWTIALVTRNALLVVIALAAVARLAHAAARHRVEPPVMAARG